MIDRSVRTFVIDLERCPTMDSTFMGTLTGAVSRLNEAGGGQVAVVNVNARNQQLLSTLGLDSLLEVDPDGQEWTKLKAEALPALAAFELDSSVTKQEQAEHVLAAHEALCDANPTNKVRFQDVIGYLKNEAK
jgi:hypothetical protein